jgi:hypothetical protein
MTAVLERERSTDFEMALRGPLLQRNDPAYGQARRLYKGMIDKRPALIVHGRDVADVIAAVGGAVARGSSWLSAAAGTTAMAGERR